MPSKLFPLSLFLAVVLCISIALVPYSDSDLSGEPVTGTDVHGISVRDNSPISLALIPSHNLQTSYELVTWYLYGHGVIVYLINNVETEAITVDGLYTFTTSYEAGTRPTVSFKTDFMEFKFSFVVRSVLSADDFVHPDNSVKVDPGELQLRDYKNIAYGAVAVLCATLVSVFLARRAIDYGDEAL